MGFQTTLRFGTDISLQGVQSITEDGKPQQICLQGLQSATTYYAMADLLEDGVRVAQSNKAKFTTLAAGAMSVTYSYYRRNSCDEHVVVYSYSSTYAPSSCILHAVGPDNFVANYQGIIDSSNNTVTFEIDDWDGGVNYDVYATLHDIYGEEQQSVTTTLTSGTINTVSLTPTAATETTVTLEIDKCDDCGFYVGWVDYWLSTQDPDTDPSIAHEYFNSTDTGITITGLTSDTAYYFRATFVCDDEQTEVTGAAVTATTAHEYGYFYLENTYNGANTFTLTKEGTPATRDLAYSFDKNTWVAFGLNSSTETVSVPQGSKIYLRSSTGFSLDGSNYIKIGMSNSHTAGGHVASLLDYTQMSSCASIPSYSLHSLLHSDTYLTNASDIDFTGVTDIGDYGCMSMFYGCSNLISSPNLDSIARIADYGCYHMLHNCGSLITIPTLSNVEGVGVYGLGSMFINCSSMTTTPDLRKLKSIGDNGCYGMFYGCVRIRSGVDFSGVTSVGNNACTYLYYNCSNLTTATAPKIATWDETKFNRWLAGVGGSGVIIKPSGLSIPTNSESGVPSGWTTQNY